MEEAAEAAAKAAARVRLCSDAYCAFWRGLSVQEKVEEKEAAAAYVREFLIAVVEGARGTPPEQVRTSISVCSTTIACWGRPRRRCRPL